MREELQNIDGVRTAFTGTVARFGTKAGWQGRSVPTMLLKDIRDPKGQIVTDHLWFTVGKMLESLKLAVDDKISFEARVTPYIKGYRGHRDLFDAPPVEVDYRLSHPTKIKRLNVAVEQLKVGETAGAN